jgi:sugar (pentulose or hexulose) kinase
VLHAGLTDGCAAFLATGARLAGEGVTSLGSTLVLKLVCDRPIFDAKSGVYSHRVGDVWVAGGASNTGGAVLAELFGRSRLDSLDAMVRADQPTGLDYYPLLRPGERFPICDPNLAPRLLPRPEAEGDYYQGVVEGIARIEAQAYRKLADLGAPPLINLRSVGGGARPAGFTAIRQRALGVPFLTPISAEAAVGAARLALWQGLLA